MLENSSKVFSADPGLGPCFSSIPRRWERSEKDEHVLVKIEGPTLARKVFFFERMFIYQCGGAYTNAANDHFLVQIYTREDDGNLCNLRCSTPCG